MASIENTLLCGLLAVILYGLVGLPLVKAVGGRLLGGWLAPAFGWAVHSVIALPFVELVGFTQLSVVLSFVLLAILAAVFTRAKVEPYRLASVPSIVLVGAFAGTVVVALALMAGGWPKQTGQGLSLAAVAFDHSKIAMIDEMTRGGVPPRNPFFGGEGPVRLAYYYLWHFSAAEFSLLTGFSGWEADAGLTGFTGLAALFGMVGIALWLSAQSSAALWVVILAFTGGARPLLEAIYGWESVQEVTGDSSGFGGFLFQTSWAPQHTMAALVAVLAIFLLVQLIKQPRILSAILLGLLMAASFQSSTWIGGVTFPLMAAPVAAAAWLRSPREERARAIGYSAMAALIALLFITPFLRDQLQMAALRNDGAPIAIEPLGVLDDGIIDTIGLFWNLAAYWLIYLPVELPAIYFAGIGGLVWLLKYADADRRKIAVTFALSGAVSLICGWLLVSRLGDNNDLGWRAVLPAVVMLMVAAAAFLARIMSERRPIFGAVAVVLIAVGLLDGLRFGYGNVVVRANASSRTFASSEALWSAVRRLTPVEQRIANNPLYLADATPWPVNISWALMANRRSCFAGRELVRPFSALSAQRVDEIQQQFERIFAGNARSDDVAELAQRYRCDTAVLVPSDGAWARDPFAASAFYKIGEDTPNWRIYRRSGP